jgi:putative ABC transport system permease protein
VAICGSILTGIFFGLIPALQLLRTDLNETLNESGRGTSASGGHARFRNSLVVTEVALAFLLFIASGLMMKSFIRVLMVEPGLNPVNLLTAELALSGKYEDPKLQTAFLKQVVERTKNLPGVESVAGTSILPLSGGSSSTYFNVVGEPQLPMDRAPGANFRAITPGFLHTMGIPLIKGRDLTEQDDGREPKALLISQSMAQK